MKRKVVYILFVSLITSSGLAYLDLNNTSIDFPVVANVLLIALYAGLGLFAGWELLTFDFEKKIIIPLRWLYYIVKFYIAIYVGLLYLPFWVFKKMQLA